MHRLWPLDPATFRRHAVHQAGDRTWPESNCYVDLWIELLQTAGLEPMAALPFTLGVDLEGDQWTFCKFPLADLATLYGIDVIELNVWRPLVLHLGEQLALGRVPIVEVDAFYLPDTAGTSYQVEHVKTTIAVQAIDGPAHRLGYFHNSGYYELEGPDFAGLFELERTGARQLPPYVEVAKLKTRTPLQGSALVAASLGLLHQHVARRPQDNPFRRYAPRLVADLESLAAAPLADFHSYAFATFRQCGAAFELAASYFRWLERHGELGLEALAATCEGIAVSVKALQFKTARLVSANRPFDPIPMLETMAHSWDVTMSGLTARYGALAHRG